MAAAATLLLLLLLLPWLRRFCFGSGHASTVAAAVWYVVFHGRRAILCWVARTRQCGAANLRRNDLSSRVLSSVGYACKKIEKQFLNRYLPSGPRSRWRVAASGSGYGIGISTRYNLRWRVWLSGGAPR